MIFKFNYSLFIFFIFFTSCSSKSYDPDETITPKVETPSIVTISQKKLFVDGNRYYIKGICYGRNGYFNYQQDIPMMVEANINTVRVYAQIFDRAELDAYHSAGIKVIMQVDYNGNYEAYVRDYMTHPAVLMWEVGNENNYHPDWFGGNLNNWYRTLEEVATKIKTIDTNHPVATAHGEVPTEIALNSCPSVDIWGMNLYRWDNNIPAIEAFIALSEKPLYISEAGADSYDSRSNIEREDLQAQATQNILSGILSKSDVCMGVTLFSFSDEWWKAGNPSQQDSGGEAPNSGGVPYDGAANEEYWGIVKHDRSKKEAYNIVKDLYN
tara:strand:- start:24435 stop:25409 length:975 start_codon:yes stop_codon:yes gene_type:complete